jgi:phage terminase large subunit
LAELKAERGDEDGEAIYQQEYMTSFSAGLPGAYYAKIIDKLENDNRITPSPTTRSAGSHGLGLGPQRRDGDLVHPAHGTGWAVIDYLANTSVGIDWYVRELKAKPTITASTFCRTTRE